MRKEHLKLKSTQHQTCFSSQKLLQCGSDCLPLNRTCNGTCRAFKSYFWPGHAYPERHRLYDTPRDSYPPADITDTYYKCPNEDLCISSNKMCKGLGDAKIAPSDDACDKESHLSREFCDHPDKYGITLNCSTNSRIQCPGNKTQQCIVGGQLCDGKFDCVDRYFLQI